MAERKKSQVVGFNHVALEVGDIDEALVLKELADKGMAPD